MIANSIKFIWHSSIVTCYAGICISWNRPKIFIFSSLVFKIEIWIMLQIESIIVVFIFWNANHQLIRLLVNGNWSYFKFNDSVVIWHISSVYDSAISIDSFKPSIFIFWLRLWLWFWHRARPWVYVDYSRLWSRSYLLAFIFYWAWRHSSHSVITFICEIPVQAIIAEIELEFWWNSLSVCVNWREELPTVELCDVQARRA